MDARKEELWVANRLLDVVVDQLTIIAHMLRTPEDADTRASLLVDKARSVVAKAQQEIVK